MASPSPSVRSAAAGSPSLAVYSQASPKPASSGREDAALLVSKVRPSNHPHLCQPGGHIAPSSFSLTLYLFDCTAGCRCLPLDNGIGGARLGCSIKPAAVCGDRQRCACGYHRRRVAAGSAGGAAHSGQCPRNSRRQQVAGCCRAGRRCCAGRHRCDSSGAQCGRWPAKQGRVSGSGAASHCGSARECHYYPQSTRLLRAPQVGYLA